MQSPLLRTQNLLEETGMQTIKYITKQNRKYIKWPQNQLTLEMLVVGWHILAMHKLFNFIISVTTYSTTRKNWELVHSLKEV